MTDGMIAKLAYEEHKPASALPHEWLLWYRLVEIYRKARENRITRDQGKAEKEEAVRSFVNQAEEYERNAVLFQRIEDAVTAYNKADVHTLEADALVKAIYGVNNRRDADVGDEQTL